jgi:hypothetical protein
MFGSTMQAEGRCATQRATVVRYAVVVAGPGVSTLPSRLVPITFSCVRQLAFVFEFPARFEVAQLERIDRQAWERVLRYPGAAAIGDRSDLAADPILGVRPARGRSWAGVFSGVPESARVSPPSQVIGWPDELSLCVLHQGEAHVVRSDDPDRWFGVTDDLPTTGVLVAAGHVRVLFADYPEVFAFGADGLAWRSGRVAYDDVTLLSVENDKVVVSGFDAPENQIVEFTLDIATGEAHGAPWTGGSSQVPGRGVTRRHVRGLLRPR